MKDSFYFQHDYNSANDQKVLKLRAKFNNAEGYGIYFMILEAMAQEDDGMLDSDCIAELSLSYNLAIDKLKAVLNFCIEIGLFIKDEKGIYSKRMIEHKNFRKERSLAGRRGAKTRWGNGSAIAQPLTKPLAQPMQRKGKERKEKEIKYNSIKSLTNEVLFELAEKHSVSKSDVFAIKQKMENWLQAKGKRYKNYKAGLSNWILKSVEDGRIKKINKSGGKLASMIDERKNV